MQNLVTFVGGLVVAFVNGWKMSLVVLSCIPLLVFAAVVQTKFIMSSSSKVGGTAALGCLPSSFARLASLRTLSRVVVWTCRGSRSGCTWFKAGSRLSFASQESSLLCRMLGGQGGALTLSAATPLAYRRAVQEDETFAQANQTASEAFTNIRTIAAFGMEGQASAARQASQPPPAPPPLPHLRNEQPQAWSTCSLALIQSHV